MTDQQIVTALINRDREVTRAFFYVNCYPLFNSIFVHYYTDCDNCVEFINEMYIYMMSPQQSAGRSKLETFRFESTLYTWIKAVCLYYCYARFEEKNRLVIDKNDEPTDRNIAVSESIQMDIDKINHEDIMKILALMPNVRYRELIRLRYLEGCSNEEMAQHLGMTMDTTISINLPKSNIFVSIERRLVMNKHFTPAISEEKFAAWLDGMLPADKMQHVSAVIENDNDFQSLLCVSDFVDDYSFNEHPLFADSVTEIDNEFLDENIAAVMDINNFQNDINMDHNIYVADGHYGETNPVQQGYSDTCAIKSQQLILNDFGVPCTEDDLVQYSYEHGWYQGNGTTMADVGNLLETAGIPVTRQADANVFNLVSELAQGHKIIVGVDSNELWENDSLFEKIKNWLSDFFMGDTPDHALIVAGIDTSDPNNIKVLVTDPGSGDYCKAYPLEQFMDAWGDSSCYMVSTDISVPQNVTGMENFNLEIGHIDNIVGVPYADFQIFNDMSYGLPIYAPTDMGYCCPMDSFVNAYLDYAHQNIGYMDIFGDNYMFNGYLQPDLITPQLQGTYDLGLTQIGFNPMNDWNNYAMVNNIPIMTNECYNDFLNQSIMDFTAMGDMQSALYCEQQMMMLDYCNNFGYDFYDTFYV